MSVRIGFAASFVHPIALVLLFGIALSACMSRSVKIDPMILRAKFEEKIHDSFGQKREEMRARGAPPSEFDRLYHLLANARGRLPDIARSTRSAEFAIPGTESSLVHRATVLVQKRHVDFALEFLEKNLAEGRELHREAPRRLAEAAVLKSDLYAVKLEREHARQAILEAVALDGGWWEVHNRLGLYLITEHGKPDWDAAEREFKEAERLVERDEDRIAVLGNLGSYFQHRKLYTEAETRYREALLIGERTLGPEHPDLIGHLVDLADLLYATHRAREAEPLYRRAMAIYDKSSTAGFSCPGAVSVRNLAELLKAENRLDEAEPFMRRAVTLVERCEGRENPQTAFQLSSHAKLLLDMNRPAEAEPLYRHALAITKQSLGPEHPQVAVSLNNLAQLLFALQRLEEAEPLFRQALAIGEKTLGPEHPYVATYLDSLAQFLFTKNRFVEAEPLFRRALAIQEKTSGREHSQVAVQLNNLARCLFFLHRPLEAEPLYRRALAISEKSFGSEHPNIAPHLDNLAQLLSAKKRFSEAEPLYRRALAIDEKHFGREDPKVATHLNNVALLLQATGRNAEAEPMMHQAVLILLKSSLISGKIHPDLRKIFANYFWLSRSTGLGEIQIQWNLAGLRLEAGYTPDEWQKILESL